MPFYIVTRRSVAEAASQQEALDITGPGEPRDPRAVVTDVRVQAMETNEAAWREINETPMWERPYRTKIGRVFTDADLEALLSATRRRASGS